MEYLYYSSLYYQMYNLIGRNIVSMDIMIMKYNVKIVKFITVYMENYLVFT